MGPITSRRDRVRMSPSSPIAVIDSGLGGLQVVRALRQALPNEEIVFLADTADRNPASPKYPNVTSRSPTSDTEAAPSAIAAQTVSS